MTCRSIRSRPLSVVSLGGRGLGLTDRQSEGGSMRKKYVTVLVAVLATALFVVPGLAFGNKGGGGGGGNGTPSPPPTNPPCDSDNHLVKLPPGIGIQKKCGGNGGTTNGTGNTGNTGNTSNGTTN